MEKHFELSNDEFERQFMTCELSPAIFSHEAHLRLAWIHIRKYGLKQAIQNIQSQLQNFVSHVGAKDKYHETLTISAILGVNHFMNKSNADNFKSFISDNPQLKNNFKELISSHYSIDIFNSEKAKVDFVTPDLSPF